MSANIIRPNVALQPIDERDKPYMAGARDVSSNLRDEVAMDYVIIVDSDSHQIPYL
jgi:hypothetical protein